MTGQRLRISVVWCTKVDFNFLLIWKIEKLRDKKCKVSQIFFDRGNIIMTPFLFKSLTIYIVGSRGASQLGGSLLGIPPGYKANKL